MRFFTLYALICLLVPGTWAAQVAPGATVSLQEEQKLAADVRDIFEAKCNDCHGSHLAKPKGKYGYVLDLQRTADNPDYVLRYHPEKSELYALIETNEMPGEDSDVPPLTPEEKETVYRWIKVGAPALAAAGAEQVTPLVAIPPANVKDPILKRLFRWVGQFHPLSTHFPVALMFVAVLAEGLAWWTKQESWLHTVRFLVVLAALSAVATMGLGWLNAYFSSYNKAFGALLWWHRWLGTAAGIWAVICAGTLLIAKCQEGSKERQRFRGALLVGAVLVGVSGFLGSALIYGLDHYSWK
ncbi:MAG TPA: DUF2231 domain-containing protein [Chthoniobacteraceae bacterium]|jgi:uncharacterized membrane protein